MTAKSSDSWKRKPVHRRPLLEDSCQLMKVMFDTAKKNIEEGRATVNPAAGIVTVLNGRAANWHGTQTQAAAVTVCHGPIAWLRN